MWALCSSVGNYWKLAAYETTLCKCLKSNYISVLLHHWGHFQTFSRGHWLHSRISEDGPPLNMALILHLEEAFFGIAPHLCSLQGQRRNKQCYSQCDNTTTCPCAALYLFAHADLHDSIVDECFPQISVFLLLKAVHVPPSLFNMLSALKHAQLLRWCF